MEIEELKIRIAHSLEKDHVFTAKIYCEELLKLETNTNLKFRYADILRLCGAFSKSEKIFLDIDTNDIPSQSRYLYYLYFGRLYIDMSINDKAKKELFKCIEFKECDTVPYIYLASLFMLENNTETAIKLLKKALAKDGDTDEVYYNLATNYAIQGDLLKAITAIDDCLKLDPGYPNAEKLRTDLLQCNLLRH